MEAAASNDDKKKNFYSVWAVPPDDVNDRLKKLMDGLRSKYRGTAAKPHITVVGAISLTEQDAVSKFRSACKGVEAYTATVDCVSPKTHCLYLLLRPTAEFISRLWMLALAALGISGTSDPLLTCLI
ncbi:Cyclic phosphodiesterase [Linum grandiflorum]